MFGPSGLHSSNTSETAKEEVKDPVQAAKDDAKADAAGIKNKFETMGAQEAWSFLEEERKKVGNLPFAEKDAWEKAMASELKNSDNKVLLPALTLAYLDKNKEALQNGNGVILSQTLRENKMAMDYSLKLEKYSKGEEQADEVDALMLDQATEHAKQFNAYGMAVSYLPNAIKTLDKAGKIEGEFVKTREEDKSVADKLVKDDKLFHYLDAANNSDKVDGKIELGEVNRFLDQVKKDSYFKNTFTEDQIKTAEELKKAMENPNNAKDKNQTLVQYDQDFNWLKIPLLPFDSPYSVTPVVTKESIAQTAKGNEGLGAVMAGAGKAVGELVKKKEGEGDNKEVDNKEGSNSEKTADEVTKDEDTKHEEATEGDKKSAEVVDKYGGEYENQLISDATQKVGEGPWQVAERLLKGKNDPIAQKALTEILKLQLIKGTESKDYPEAVSKLKVGYNFLTCEGLNDLRKVTQKLGNQTLIDLFGEPKMDEAAKKVMYVWGKPVVYEA